MNLDVPEGLSFKSILAMVHQERDMLTDQEENLYIHMQSLCLTCAYIYGAECWTPLI